MPLTAVGVQESSTGMDDFEGILVEHWAVDYGDGASPENVAVPHSWRQDVSLSHEGPVTYRTGIKVPARPSKLVFHGVSYAAAVSIDGCLVARHEGIWDAFEVPLRAFSGRDVDVTVVVIKNGGPTYPVCDVASGFLPFVFHTFGGIFREVSIVPEGFSQEADGPSVSRFQVEKSQIYVDGKPFYVRGVLHWGWYPEIGHPNPTRDMIRREVSQAKSLGFNLVKFCLWVPPHEYLDILREHEMEAWIELPLWNPTSDPAKQDRIRDEFERIVRQYRHHDNVLLWTVGCELSGNTSYEYRTQLTWLVTNLTGSPLVKDNSGGAEMYGGDLREFGDFYDFHPYCDTQFYPAVLDSLLPGPRSNRPLLLGEFNDSDAHRDLPRLGEEIPYWCSTLSELNDQGVRWQYDLPSVLRDCRFATDPEESRHANLVRSSREKTLFIRKTVQEAVRARNPISGYVITGWRDTPISSSGFVDDWDEPRFTPAECAEWNGAACLFPIPTRRPPWIRGGNRPGYRDPFNQFTGQVYLGIGLHADRAIASGLVWRILDANGAAVAKGLGDWTGVDPLESAEVGWVDWHCERPGAYRLEAEFGGVRNSWPLWVAEPLAQADLEYWGVDDPMQLFDVVADSGPAVLTTRSTTDLRLGLAVLTAEGTIGMPFWRESAFEFLSEPFWNKVGFTEAWGRLLPISPDRALDRHWLDALGAPYEVLLNRVDVRTYREDPILVRTGDTFLTTLRPFGGLGNQPSGLRANAAGVDFIRGIRSVLESR